MSKLTDDEKAALGFTLFVLFILAIITIFSLILTSYLFDFNHGAAHDIGKFIKSVKDSSK